MTGRTNASLVFKDRAKCGQKELVPEVFRTRTRATLWKNESGKSFSRMYSENVLHEEKRKGKSSVRVHEDDAFNKK